MSRSSEIALKQRLDGGKTYGQLSTCGISHRAVMLHTILAPWAATPPSNFMQRNISMPNSLASSRAGALVGADFAAAGCWRLNILSLQSSSVLFPFDLSEVPVSSRNLCSTSAHISCIVKALILGLALVVSMESVLAGTVVDGDWDSGRRSDSISSGLTHNND